MNHVIASLREAILCFSDVITTPLRYGYKCFAQYARDDIMTFHQTLGGMRWM